MKIKSYKEAFLPGCELWILGDKSQSLWARHFDWHLNFEFAKVQHRSSTILSPEMLKTLKEYEIEETKISSRGRHRVLIASSQWVPSKMCLSLKCDDPQHWVREIQVVWQDLGRPPMRIFAPEKLSSKEFSRLWTGNTSDLNEVEFVESFPTSSDK